jgi:cytochrome c oxidase subunit 2
VNNIWFTPDSMTEKAFNGVCVEFCGASHANMRFRAFVVSPAEFDSWAKYQASPASMVPAPFKPATPPPAAGTKVAAAPPAPAPMITQVGYYYPTADLPAHVKPTTPVPTTLTFDEGLLSQGRADSGMAILNKGGGGCVGCHTIGGFTMMAGVIGPNLTHLASRSTLGAGLFPNDAKHLALWIKNARLMKPGIVMPSLGKGQIDPQTKKVSTMASLSDQQIADIVAYLRTLK